MIYSFSIAFIVAASVMGLGYLYSTLKSYYSIVDVLWAYSFSFVVVGLFFKHQSSDLFFFIAIPFILWSVRLGTHLLTRLLKHFPTEDGRYLDLKSTWSKNLNRNFLFFYLFQALSVVFLSTPLIVVLNSPDSEIGPLTKIGFLISFLSWIGESVADKQLATFRSNPQNKGGVCNTGLWRYSRHPNYFFEWMIWVGFAVMATSVEYGYLAWISPITMYYLLNYVTGIPYAEAQSLKSRGEKFVAYQKTTSAFFPWF